MARIATATKIKKAAMPNGKSGRSTPISPKPPTKLNKQAAALKAAVAVKQVASGPRPKVSKDELRAQVQRLEQANVTLRSKSREMTKAAKASVTRVAELESQVARFGKSVAASRTLVTRGPHAKPAGFVGGKRQTRSVGPNGSVAADTHLGQPTTSEK